MCVTFKLQMCLKAKLGNYTRLSLFVAMLRCCLLMIVRDESSVIERALDSAKELFDYYIICDTGSIDDTKEKISSWADRNEKSGEVISRVWKNFGQTKSELWSYAYSALKDISSHFVWLDADEVFFTRADDPLSYPTAEDANALFQQFDADANSNILMLQTTFGNLRYRRPQLCKNNQLYEWKQPVHEYFVGTVNSNTMYFEGIGILARKEGNSARNPDRYQKDIQMFLDFLSEHPNEPRALFYLAQSYESVGDKDNAYHYYCKRIEVLDGYYQERYVACLRAGRLATQNEIKLQHFFKGTTIIPHRLECYFEMMCTYRNLGDHRRACAMSMIAPEPINNVRYTDSNDMMLEQDIYDWRFDFDLGISAWYAKEMQRGRQANERALLRAPSNIIEQIKINLSFYPSDEDVASSKSSSQYTRTSTVEDKVQLVVIDNFFDNPDEIRNLALQQPFTVKGNYPGLRTECMLQHEQLSNMRKRFEELLGKTITFWPDGYNGSFQYASEDMSSWIHRDMTEYSAIVYLTPNAPVNSGTMFYKHKLLNAFEANSNKENTIMNNDTYAEDKWELVDQVANVYNRCVIFRGKRSHISGPYFGHSVEDSRLFMMFFFDC